MQSRSLQYHWFEKKTNPSIVNVAENVFTKTFFPKHRISF